MDDSGRIRKFASDEEAAAAGFRHPLSQREARFLETKPPEVRKELLALRRFMAHPERSGVAASLKGRLENAFIQGWKAREET